MKNGSSGLQHTTNIIGTSVSGFFLYLIAALNIIVLVGIVRVFREMRTGKYDDAELERQLEQAWAYEQLLRRLRRKIDTPWKMYPVGFLFGLGFDTATEVALLVLAGTAVVGGLPFYAVLSLPILFAAGMSLFDTMDGCFMNFAYDWAFAKPGAQGLLQPHHHRALDLAWPFFVGTVEIWGPRRRRTANLNRLSGTSSRDFNINIAGFAIVGLFVATWGVALSYLALGHVEEKWDASMPQEPHEEVVSA